MNDRTIKKSHKSYVCQLLMLKNKTKEIKDRKIFLFFVFSGCFPLHCQSQRKGSKTETKTKREKRRSNIFLRSNDIFYRPLISLSLHSNCSIHDKRCHFQFLQWKLPAERAKQNNKISTVSITFLEEAFLFPVEDSIPKHTWCANLVLLKLVFQKRTSRK